MAVWCYTLASDYGGWPGQVNVHTNLGRWSFFSGQKVLSTHWIPRSKSSEASAEPGTRWSSKHNFCDVAFATSGSDRLQLSIANWPNMLIQPTFPRVKLSGLQIKSAILLELLGLKLLKCYKTSWFKPNILHPTNPRKKKKNITAVRFTPSLANRMSIGILCKSSTCQTSPVTGGFVGHLGGSPRYLPLLGEPLRHQGHNMTWFLKSCSWAEPLPTNLQTPMFLKMGQIGYSWDIGAWKTM